MITHRTNDSVFSWTRAVLLQPLPGVTRANEIVAVSSRNRDGDYQSLSVPDYRDIRDRAHTLAGLLIQAAAYMSVTWDNRADRVFGQVVSGNYFDVLSVSMAAGRWFSLDEDRTPGTHAVVVISHPLSQRRFGGTPSIVGTDVLVNGKPFTIIGVTNERFQGSSASHPLCTR